ncbi:MAG: hypothetical protein Q9163_000992 [Psora crenata]
MAHHKSGRIQLYNIHDPANLVALCSICHFAFDNDEWTFIPEETTIWTQKIDITPQIIEEYNSQRNIVFRRLLLDPDPDSPAFQDTHYRSAFTNSPTKVWLGEPGVLIVRPPYAPPPEPTAELLKTLHDFRALQDLWLKYKNLCSQEECPICQTNDDGKQGKEDHPDNKEDDDSEDKADNKEDDREDDGENDEEDNEEDDEEDNKEDDEEYDEEDDDDTDDEMDDKEVEAKRKSIQALKQYKKLNWTTSAPSDEEDDEEDNEEDNEEDDGMDDKEVEAKRKSIQALKQYKKLDWTNSTPYDESVPFSHRWGYSYANMTSNDLMKMWQAYRKPIGS